MTYPVAILQGRLSPSTDGRFQFFPQDWASEFGVAKAMGFAGIEWLCDWPEMAKGINPLTSVTGRSDIGEVVRATHTPVISVCADWYMKRDLRQSEQVMGDWLLTVLEAATHTSDRRVLIPLLEANAPRDDSEEQLIVGHLKRFLPVLEKLQVCLAFETEMKRERLAHFVDAFGSPQVGVYYDIGNCTSYGFDCPSDIEYLSERVKGVHIKDRKRNSTQSVPLGKGDANIRGSLEALRNIGWKGHLVLQAWRSPSAYLQDAKQQLAYMHEIQKEVFSNA